MDLAMLSDKAPLEVTCWRCQKVVARKDAMADRDGPPHVSYYCLECIGDVLGRYGCTKCKKMLPTIRVLHISDSYKRYGSWCINCIVDAFSNGERPDDVLPE